MTTRLITAMTADQVRAQRQHMTAVPKPANTQKPKRDRSRKKLAKEHVLTPMAFSRQGNDWRVVQMPLYTSGQRSWGIWHDRHSMVDAQVNTTWFSLCAWEWLARHRSDIQHIELVRVAPRELDTHDNLPSAFKAIMDAVCSWVVEGDKVRDPAFNRKKIGRYDDAILQSKKNPEGITWSYGQTKCASNPRAYGVEIRFRLAPSSE